MLLRRPKRSLPGVVGRVGQGRQRPALPPVTFLARPGIMLGDTAGGQAPDIQPFQTLSELHTLLSENPGQRQNSWMILAESRTNI
jgi:hypothetical protein